MSGWGDLFGKIANQFQDRHERLQNEHSRLTKEKEKILKGEWSEEKAIRLEWINNRINTINELFKNAPKK